MCTKSLQTTITTGKNKLGPDNNPYFDQIITLGRANLDQLITSQLVAAFQIEVEGIARESLNEEAKYQNLKSQHKKHENQQKKQNKQKKK